MVLKISIYPTTDYLIDEDEKEIDFDWAVLDVKETEIMVKLTF